MPPRRRPKVGTQSYSSRLIFDEGYEDGYSDGYRARMYESGEYMERGAGAARAAAIPRTRRKANPVKRTPNRWNKYVAKKGNAIRYKAGAQKGKLNLGAMGTKYRKKYKLKKGKK